MKNNFSNDLNLLKTLKSLVSSPCAGCVFFKVGECSIKDVYIHYNNLDEFPSSVENCNLKITHDDFSDIIIEDYFGSFFNKSENSLLDNILSDIKNFKDAFGGN